MQKKVGNALYVFDTTPFTITEDTNVEVIYVQYECLKGYLELNTELESKIKTFNQWLLCVNAPWADTGTSEPTKNYHLLTVSGSSTQDLWVQHYDESLPPGNNNESFFDSYNQWQREAGMINTEEYNKIYCNAGAIIYIDRDINEFATISEGLEKLNILYRGEHYGVIMGDSDMTVDFSYTLKPTHHVNLSTDSNASADIEIDPQERYAGGTVWIRFKNNQSSSTITVTSADVELTYDQPNDEYSFTMPAHDVTIKAVYATQQPQNYHLLTVPITDRLYITGYDTKLPPGDATHAWFISFNQFQRDAGMIDNAERNKIYCNAGAKVFINNDINDVETVTGLELIDTQWGKKYGFVMGDSDMTADFSYTLKPKYHVSFSADSNVYDGYVEISDSEQYAGKNVYIRLNGGENSSTITVTSNDVELTYDQPNNQYYFVMPEHDVTIKAYWPPIQISIDLGNTDLTYRSDTPYDPSGTYYKHAYFIVQPGNGKTTDNYTFNKSDDTITVDNTNNLFSISFINSGSVTFANA